MREGNAGKCVTADRSFECSQQPQTAPVQHAPTSYTCESTMPLFVALSMVTPFAPCPNTVQLLTTTLLTAFAETPVSFACATVTPCRVTCEVPSRVTALSATETEGSSVHCESGSEG